MKSTKVCLQSSNGGTDIENGFMNVAGAGVGMGFWLPCFEKTADILGALPIPEWNPGEAFDVHHLT